MKKFMSVLLSMMLCLSVAAVDPSTLPVPEESLFPQDQIGMETGENEDDGIAPCAESKDPDGAVDTQG